MQINKYIDHTILKADAPKSKVQQIIDEAKKYDFMSVCINPTWVNYASQELKDSDVKVCTVIGFPLGANTSELKAFEAKNAIENGADEIDMVINIGAAKSKDWDLVESDIADVNAVKGDKLLKVIIETSLLTDEEKIKACQIAKAVGADFVKTSTGFSTEGATFHVVKIFADNISNGTKIKAAGGISSLEDAEKFIELGADRLGTSRIVKIVKNENTGANEY